MARRVGAEVRQLPTRQVLTPQVRQDRLDWAEVPAKRGELPTR